MRTAEWLEVLTRRYEWHAQVRDSKLAQNDLSGADLWHWRCTRLTSAIGYLESRLERAS